MPEDERLFPLPGSADPSSEDLDRKRRRARRCRGCRTELEGAPASQDGRGVWRCMQCTLDAVAAGEPGLLTPAPDQLTFGGDDGVGR